MLKFLSKFFDQHQKKINEFQAVVETINSLEKDFEELTDTELKDKTEEFRDGLQSLIKSGKTPKQALDSILPEAFATVREAARRSLGLRHYDVQLIAGMAFHHGNIAEQKTGEGKTLSATLALYLNSLLQKGTHLVTVNDYLSQVGAGWMGPLYETLGVSVGVIINDGAYLYDSEFRGAEKGDDRLEHFRPVTRKEAYEADITYGTNNEFGFDYLRDNMAQALKDMVQREHYFAIVDEADSILIDEARTPLIISAPDSEPTRRYYDFARLVQGLGEDSDFKLDEKMKTVVLTDLGVKRVEQKLGVKNLYEEGFDTIHHVEAALKAKTLYRRDKEYIVRDKQVIIVDEHTGRLMYGRRYSDGLHQAIEAKEGVDIQQESRTLATISLQNYFRLYEKLAGMSGTAVTESEEFQKIYHVDVLPIPTHRPVVREDYPDIIYKTTRAKYAAIVQEVQEKQELGQPVLIGTRSIDHNQIISDFLSRKKVPHQVLNAKNHEKEAFIIADAGKKGQVTVATNIAGRGVDIVLGGTKPELKNFAPPSKEGEKSKPKPDKAAYTKALKQWEKDHDEVVASGGLHVIGSERHESRRIDNQLRGRSGRQGDSGSSRFYVSLEDEIMRLFGGEQISKMMDFLKIEEDQPIEHGMIGKAIESAQIKVEGFFFDQRKRLVEFDDVMNKQREIIYKRRRRLLELADSADNAGELKSQVLDWIKDEIVSIVSMHASDKLSSDEISAVVKDFLMVIPFDPASQQAISDRLNAEAKSPEQVTEHLFQVATDVYEQREKNIGEKAAREVERFVVLRTLDEMWMDHLDDVQSLRDGIWLRGDKQAVLSEYKKEAFGMFESLVNRIESEVAKRVFRVQVTSQVPAAPTQMVTKKDNSADLAKAMQKEQLGTAQPATQSGGISDLAKALQSAKAVSKPKPGIAMAKIGRNDPCPCGSGKKWKKCGMINAPWHKG